MQFAQKEVFREIQGELKRKKLLNPDGRLGYKVRDSCSSPLFTATQAQGIPQENQKLSTLNDLQLTFSNSTQFCETPLVVMVGPPGNDATSAISPLLSSVGVSHISFMASSEVFQSRRNFPHLFRTVPEVHYEAKALADIIQTFGWKYVAMISSYRVFDGREVAVALEAEAASRNETFCFAMKARIKAGDTSRFPGIMTELATKYVEARAIVLLFNSRWEVLQFFAAMKTYNITNRVIVSSLMWMRHINPPLLPKGVGLITLSPRPVNFKRTESFSDYLQRFFRRPNLVKEEMMFNPYIRPFLEDRLRCNISGLSGVEYQCSSMKYDGVLGSQCRQQDLVVRHIPKMEHLGSLILAAEVAAVTTYSALANRKMVNGCLDTAGINREIHCKLSNVQLPCQERYFVKGGGNPDGKACPVFTDQGSAFPVFTVQNLQERRSGGRVELVPVAVWSNLTGETLDTRLNWLPGARLDWGSGQLVEQNDSNKWPISICSLPCSAGYRQVFHDPFLFQCCWTCFPCEDGTVSASHNADECRQCPRGYTPNANRSQCMEIEPRLLNMGDTAMALTMSVNILGALAAVFTMILFWRFRSDPMVRAADLTITYTMLFAMVIGFISTLVVFRRPTDTGCKVWMALIRPIPTTAIAGVLVKTNRFAQIFSTKTFSRGRQSQPLLSTPIQLAFIFGLTLMQVLIIVIGIAVTMPGTKRIFERAEIIYLVCDWNTAWQAAILVYDFILIMVCLCLAFQTRHLPEKYNEARHIFMASLLVFFAWLGVLPATFFTPTLYQPVILCLTVTAVYWAIWACLHAHRIYKLILQEYNRRKGSPSSPVEARDKSSSNHVPSSPNQSIETTI